MRRWIWRSNPPRARVRDFRHALPMGRQGTSYFKPPPLTYLALDGGRCEIYVSRNEAQAVVATKVLVLPAPPRLTGIWPFLMLPPVAIALFALHQALLRDSQTPW